MTRLLTTVVALAGVLLATGASVAAGAPSSAKAAPPAGSKISAQITIAHHGPGRPSLVTVQVYPPEAPRGGEMLLSIYRPGVMVNRRVIAPSSPGVYRAEYRFPADGVWRYYVRFGPGQAGFATGGYIDIENKPGAVDRAAGRFRSGLRRAPAYVQPAGYAVFGFIAAVALAGIAAVMSRLRRVYSTAAGTQTNDAIPGSQRARRDATNTARRM